MAIMIVLFVSELNSYLEIDTTSEMYIDVNRGGEMVTEFPLSHHNLS